ncbi:uncharacterized protein LOC132198372 [Neocloeon triangulifer]|uniref:uncharacterized protein LOC132198372 n=1 Tax=Neocloeon triangulifer TaxID=2078957 RepID=UPI00286F7D99|nr:uncharacterized protein LOC132198372 [Neocloeon triangulifer]
MRPPTKTLLLLVVAFLGTTTAVADQVAAADSTDIANQIVQQLQTLGHHKYPSLSSPRSANHASASNIHYDASPYYEPYGGSPHDTPTYIKFQEPEPTMDPNITPSGINVNAALGYISYLVLLVLLQGAVEGVAARSSRRRRSVRSLGGASSEDLLGRGLELMNDMGLLRAESLATLPESVLAALGKQVELQHKFGSKKVQRMLKNKKNKMSNKQSA